MLGVAYAGVKTYSGPVALYFTRVCGDGAWCVRGWLRAFDLCGPRTYNFRPLSR